MMGNNEKQRLLWFEQKTRLVDDQQLRVAERVPDDRAGQPQRHEPAFAAAARAITTTFRRGRGEGSGGGSVHCQTGLKGSGGERGSRGCVECRAFVGCGHTSREMRRSRREMGRQPWRSARSPPPSSCGTVQCSQKRGRRSADTDAPPCSVLSCVLEARRRLAADTSGDMIQSVSPMTVSPDGPVSCPCDTRRTYDC